MADQENTYETGTQRVPRREVLRAGALSLMGWGLTSFGSTTGPIRAAQPSEKERTTSRTIRLPAHYYQQFDADFALEVPAEGYGGWKTAPVDLSWEHTAVVVMHAWDCGTCKEFPGWYRAVEYIPRSYAICEKVFPPLLGAVREHGFRLFHVVAGGDYYKQFPGYRRAVAFAGPSQARPEQIESDASLRRLRQFRSEHVF